MVYKLKRKSFSGTFLNIIEAVINNIIQIPKINGGLLPSITTLLGLKQGDDLSPILFYIFFDDVEEIFDDSCDLIELHNGLSINHLIYADDMAILSLSSEGLQDSLKRSYTYCNKWRIEVSAVETKILKFNTSGKLLKGYRFHYNSKNVEQVKEFKYLGTTFSVSGNFSCGKEKLRKQAYKSYFHLLKALHEKDLDTVPSLHLFDLLIVPIFNYNSEVWSQLSKQSRRY